MSSTNLIVNYLPTDLKEDELRSLFSKSGRVNSVKIVRNRNTVMDTLEEAEAAITALNHHEVRGKYLRVSLAKTKGELDKEENNTNLYITGITTDMNEAQLENHFKKFGAIISCKIVRNSAPTEKGIAFVKFVKREDADNAIKATNGKIICKIECDGKECSCPNVVNVKYAIPGGKNSLKNLHNPSLPVYVQFSHYPNAFLNPFHAVPTLNIPTKQEVSTSLPNYGYAPGYLQALVGPRVTPTPLSTRPPASMPANPYYNYSNYSMYGASYPSVAPYPPVTTYTPAQTTPAVPGSITPSNIAKLASGQHCLFIYGLPQATTEEELMSLFLPFGAISSCRICYDNSDGKRVCKGYGFVNYYGYNDAVQAVSCMNNYSYKGQHLQVRFKIGKDVQ